MKYLLFFALSFMSTYGLCQISAITEDGRKVELKSNGTWEFIVVEAPETAIVVITEPCNCLYEFLVNEVDEFTGIHKKSLKPAMIGKSDANNRLDAAISQADERYEIHLVYHGDLGCMVNEKSTAIITFNDDSTIEIEHIGKTDCDDWLMFVGDVSLMLNEFRTKTVKRIRLSGSDSYDDITVYEAYYSYFIEAFNCCIF